MLLMEINHLKLLIFNCLVEEVNNGGEIKVENKGGLNSHFTF